MDGELAQLLTGFPVYITLTVQWGDQDAFGHVNNTVYLRWFESARIAYSDRAGLAQLDATQRVAPILAALSCNYRRQIQFPDTVHIGARISKIGRSSMTMEHRVVSEKLRAIAAEGDSVVVTYDYVEKKTIRVPDDLRAAIAHIEGRLFE